MTTRLAILALIALALRAQTPVTIHLTAQAQQKGDTTVAFGRLGNHLVAAPDLCLDKVATLKVATARVRQAVKLPDGYTLLPLPIATSVIQDAQGKAPLATASRVLTGLSGGAAAAVAIKAVPTTGWGSGVILGGEAAAIVLQFIFPTLQTHAVISSASLLPELLEFDSSSGACVSGIVLISTPKKARAIGTLDQDIIVIPTTGVAQ